MRNPLHKQWGNSYSYSRTEGDIAKESSFDQGSGTQYLKAYSSNDNIFESPLSKMNLTSALGLQDS